MLGKLAGACMNVLENIGEMPKANRKTVTSSNIG